MAGLYSPVCSSDGGVWEVLDAGSTENTRLATFLAMAGTAGFLKLHSETTAQFFSGNRIIVDATPGVPPFIATMRVPYLGSTFDDQPKAQGDGAPPGRGGR